MKKKRKSKQIYKAVGWIVPLSIKSVGNTAAHHNVVSYIDHDSTNARVLAKVKQEIVFPPPNWTYIVALDTYCPATNVCPKKTRYGEEKHFQRTIFTLVQVTQTFNWNIILWCILWTPCLYFWLLTLSENVRCTRKTVVKDIQKLIKLEFSMLFPSTKSAKLFRLWERFPLFLLEYLDKYISQTFRENKRYVSGNF